MDILPIVYILMAGAVLFIAISITFALIEKSLEEIAEEKRQTRIALENIVKELKIHNGNTQINPGG